MNHQEFLISDIMPKREVHLICGPSGVGKTNLSLEGLQQLILSGEWLGKKIPKPVGVFYLSIDRSKDSVRRALDRHKIPHDAFSWSVGEAIPKGPSGSRITEILSWIHSNHPKVELVFIDGFANLLGGNMNDYQAVSDFLRIARNACSTYNLTVLGSVHSPKMKSDEFIPNPRQRVMGSGAWAGFTDLIIVLDPEEANHPENPNRIIRVLPRDAAEYTLHFRNEGGILVPILPDDYAGQRAKIEREIELAEPGTTWTTKALRAMLPVPKTTFNRWLSLATASGLLVRVSRGAYKRFGAGEWQK